MSTETIIELSDKISDKLHGSVEFIVKNALTGERIDDTPVRCNAVVNDAKFSLLRGVTDTAGSSHFIDSIKFGTDFTDSWAAGTGTVTTNGGNNRILDLTGGNFNTVFGGITTDVYVQVGGETRLVLSYSATQAIMDQALTVPAAASAYLFVNNGESPFAPQAATATYDTTSMDIAFDSSIPAYTFVKNYNLVLPQVSLSVEIIGADVMAQNLTVSSVTMTSAALHTANGEVFSYLRFPKISMNELINITVVWTLYYV